MNKHRKVTDILKQTISYSLVTLLFWGCSSGVDKETRKDIFEIEDNFVNALKSKDFEKASGYLTTPEDTTSTRWLKDLYSQFQNNAKDEIENRLRPEILNKWVIKKDSANFLVKESRKYVDVEAAKEMYDHNNDGVSFEKYIPLLAMDGILPTFKDTVNAYEVTKINNKYYLDLDLTDYKQLRKYIMKQRSSLFDKIDIKYQIYGASSSVVTKSFSINMDLLVINKTDYDLKIGFDVVVSDNIYTSVNNYNVSSKDTAIIKEWEYEVKNEITSYQLKRFGTEDEDYDGIGSRYIIDNRYIAIEDTTINFTKKSGGAVFKMALNETEFEPEHTNIMIKVLWEDTTYVEKDKKGLLQKFYQYIGIQ